MHFLPIKYFISQKNAGKKTNYWPQGLQIIAFQQSFSKCWWKRPILRGHSSKNLLKLGDIFNWVKKTKSQNFKFGAPYGCLVG